MTIGTSPPKLDTVGTTTAKSTIYDSPAYGKTGTTMPTELAPESLMLWLQTQMRKSNKDVQEILHLVDTGRGRLQSLQALQQQLRNMKDGCRPDDGTSKVAMQDVKGHEEWDKLKDAKTGAIDMAALEKTEWYGALSAEGKGEVVAFLEKWNRGEGKDNKVMEAQIDTLLDKVKDEISNINSENEIQMINLQHIMQTRNQAIQLCSNIISVLDRALETPINNIGKG